MQNTLVKLRYPFFLACAVLALFGCVSAPQEEAPLAEGFYPEASEARKTTWTKLVGSWYGSRKLKNGGTYSWVMRRSANGLYRLEAKTEKPSGEVQLQIEVGEWGAGNSIYFDIFRGSVSGNEIIPSDSSDPYNRDIYKILKLTEREFQYQHLDNGESFKVKKVADDFQMP